MQRSGSVWQRVSIPFREVLHSDSCLSVMRCREFSTSFHPFQGSAPFGRLAGLDFIKDGRFVSIPFREVLHSDLATSATSAVGHAVSIPFREVLHSDRGICPSTTTETGFHPFQGRAPFGHDKELWFEIPLSIRFHPFQGSAPFGQCQSIVRSSLSFGLSFHPFQGSAPFGQYVINKSDQVDFRGFHPFQGSAPFGRQESCTQSNYTVSRFPSLSGKCSIRTLVNL